MDLMAKDTPPIRRQPLRPWAGLRVRVEHGYVDRATRRALDVAPHATFMDLHNLLVAEYQDDFVQVRDSTRLAEFVMRSNPVSGRGGGLLTQTRRISYPQYDKKIAVPNGDEKWWEILYRDATMEERFRRVEHLDATTEQVARHLAPGRNCWWHVDFADNLMFAIRPMEFIE